MRGRLICLAVFTTLLAARGQDTPTPQGWTAKTVHWQTSSPDGTKWAVLEGKADVPGKSTQPLFRQGIRTNTRTVQMLGWRWPKALSKSALAAVMSISRRIQLAAFCSSRPM